jgi:hypothetical protein
MFVGNISEIISHASGPKDTEYETTTIKIPKLARGTPPSME